MSPIIDESNELIPHAKSWWRRNRGWLFGAAILALPAFGWPLYSAWRQYEIRHANNTTVVPVGQWGELEGARWRLVDITRENGQEPRSPLRLRDDAALIRVRYQVVLDEGTSPKRIDGCRGRMVDEIGRQWEANSPVLPYVPGGPPRTCASWFNTETFKTEYARPGEPFTFEHAYLIPAAVQSDGLRVGIWFPVLSDAEQPGVFMTFSLE